MKSSGAPDIGDLVVAKVDKSRNIRCLGFVVQCRGIRCQVMWGSSSLQTGWWNRNALEVISESR